MSHQPPKTMKGLTSVSQRPMAKSERPIKTSTLDLMHAKELERRSTVQRISGPKPNVAKGPK